MNPETLLKIAKRIYPDQAFGILHDDVITKGQSHEFEYTVFTGLSDTDMKKMMVEFYLDVIWLGDIWRATSIDDDIVGDLAKTPNEAALNCVVKIVEKIVETE